jgi:hypothetical protein
MNIEQFKEKYKQFKDIDKIEITCDYSQHEPKEEIIIIGKQPAKRNILKNNGENFICRDCVMKHNNPVHRTGQRIQSNEIISVVCPHESHIGDRSRKIKRSGYYGANQQPYIQVCGSCIQLNKKISEEQKEKIRLALTGIERSDEFKNKLSVYMKNNQKGIDIAKNNLIPGAGAGWNEGLETSEEVKQKMSIAHSGKEFTHEHCENISVGRKKMLEETGGFTREHRENISKAVVLQYQNGFEPKLHHVTGWHISPKAGKVYFRSSYEKKAYIKLDDDDTVETYKVESMTTEYFNPDKNINSTYLIDLLIEYKDGSKKLVEVKPEQWLKDEVIKAKIEAGNKKAQSLNIPFEVWTEMNLFGHVYNKKNMNIFIQKIKRGLV